VVRRLVEQQHVGLRSSRLAQRDAAALATRDLRDVRVPRRQAQRIGAISSCRVEVVAVGRLDQRLEARLLGGDLVEIGVRVRVRGIDLLESLEGSLIGCTASSTLPRTSLRASSCGSCAGSRS
jgi:hypothetical protein